VPSPRFIRARTISLQRMQAVLLQTGALTTIAGYLKLLEAAGLVASLAAPLHAEGALAVGASKARGLETTRCCRRCIRQASPIA
jgi:hypothetical protein